jgi:hypothetical protein
MDFMEYKGFKARIMKAPRLIGQQSHRLPPGSPIEVYPVDVFQEPLQNWISGPGNYVVPVDADWGLWFDWTQNDQQNTAVLLSIKGMNPITGQRSNGFALERYVNKCPIHDIEFKDGLFCEKCNYKWPVQNYVAYPNKLWWDGFRSEDGKVRQFFFTDELEKSIPELVIGKEDTIPAFGFAFFSPKVRRSLSSFTTYGSSDTFKSSSIFNLNSMYLNHSKSSLSFQTPIYSYNTSVQSSDHVRGTTKLRGQTEFLASLDSAGFGERGIETKQKKQIAEVGVGAGAIIDQNLNVDPLKISEWNDEPDSVIRLYFVFVEQFERIKAKGFKDLVGEKEGFLAGLPTG